MALKLLQTSGVPLGQLDGYDTDYLSVTGGEIGRLMSVPFAHTADAGAADVFDGYSPASNTRPAVSRLLPATAGTYRPLFLLDDGTTGYGMAFGTVVGGVTGTVVPNPSDLTGATVLGLHTATGSGKITCWHTPGLFAVTMNSVATSLTIQSAVTAGDPLYANTWGQLTATAAESFDFASTAPTVVGRFFDFSTNGSLVTTPVHIAKGNTAARQLTQMVFHFRVEN
jgi:hypothetical protein